MTTVCNCPDEWLGGVMLGLAVATMAWGVPGLFVVAWMLDRRRKQ